MLNWADLHQYEEKYRGTLEMLSITIFAFLTIVFVLCFAAGDFIYFKLKKSLFLKIYKIQKRYTEEDYCEQIL